VARKEKNIVDIDVAEEMRSSFLEYAYSVIYARALPDARDGLKPVQRRILFQMAAMGLRPDRGHVKSARVVGEVMGRLHPHGDSAIYDALVRMAQPFTLRLPLIDGHGNFGSVDDGPAAMRYTEARMAQAAVAMTANLDEDVVDFASNYDGREQEPEVLPAAFPNLLVNGASGIAVGMATNLVPHNLAEVVTAARQLIANPKMSLQEIMSFVPGPDFPTGGVIIGLDGIRDAYETGRGSFRVRARTRIEQTSPRRKGIVVTELPMNVGPERVIERLKDLVQSKKLQGIYDVTDLTDGDSGLNLVIEVKSGMNPEAILEQLYKMTPLEETVSINAVALVGGQPRTLGLLELLHVFVDHRLTVTRRRSAYRQRKAQDRLHLVEGLLVAIIDIDEVIALIRSSDDAAAARERLMSVFDLSDTQASYILEMPLRRLTKFSRIELETERDELNTTISELIDLLSDDAALRARVSDELAEVAQGFSTPRRTLLSEMPANVEVDVNVPDSPCLVVLSSTGLIARVPDMGTPMERAAHDVIIAVAPSRSHGEVGLVTSKGRVLRVSVIEIPSLPVTAASPSLAAGAPIGAFVQTTGGETVVGLLPLDGEHELLLATATGRVKRVHADHPRNKDDWTVMPIAEDDAVIGARAVSESEAEHADLALVTSDAQLLRFPASSVRAQGRAGSGVTGIGLGAHAHVIAAGVVDPGVQAQVVTIAGSSTALPGTQAGSVKVSDLTEFPAKGRGTRGMRCHKFRRGEDVLVLAAVGPAPVRAASASGVPVELPQEISKRDGTGTPGTVPILGLAGHW
jgi:DNA gyrase subunit A